MRSKGETTGMRDTNRSAVQPCRILSAEDDDVDREVLRLGRTRHEYEVEFSDNGAEALGELRTTKFHLVLMDVQMPVMDGLEATRRIRKLPKPLCDIPIIGLTANVLIAEVRTYICAGMNECFPKPIDWNRLADTIARYLPRKPVP